MIFSELHVRTVSTLDLERQVGSDGATWLDRSLSHATIFPLPKNASTNTSAASAATTAESNGALVGKGNSGWGYDRFRKRRRIAIAIGRPRDVRYARSQRPFRRYGIR
jgi:hypothetical protein